MLKNTLQSSFIFTLFLLSVLTSCKKDNQLLEKVAIYNTSHTINWMQDLLELYPNARLKDICIPGAHDAGMYQLNNCLLGNACNVQTQYLDMKNMLESGIRFFDVRPVLKDGVFWTYHAKTCNGLGCYGDNMENFLQQTKDYLDYHNELIIFELTHFCNTSAQETAFLNLLTSILGDRIYKDDGSLSTEIVDRPLPTILNNEKGKVILLMDGLSTATENRSEGFFAHSYLKKTGSYANQYIFDEMINNQLTKFNNFDETGNSIFNLYYTLTLNDSLAFDCAKPGEHTSIESLTLEARNKITTTFDGWISNQTIVKGKIPNIIYVDFANTTITEECIKISKFNLE